MTDKAKNLRTFSFGFTIVELLVVVVVIAILASITIVGYNNITTRTKETARVQEISSWKTKSELRKIEIGSVCPENYSFVYGNSVLGTSDFCVMKYEAKNVGGIATSQAAGAPWSSISFNSATTAAATAGGRLLTDAEWMTIAADVLSVKYNWTGGAVGSGIINKGHVNGDPLSALAASTDDADNLYGITGKIGTGPTNNSSRVLYLSSGDTLWDFSGNVGEWTIAQTVNQIGNPGDTTATWTQWTASTLNMGNLPTTSRPSALSSYTNPITGASLAGITSWNSSNGIGVILTNYADTTLHPFRRGGDWNYGAYSGVLSLFLTSSTTGTDALVGFRVAI